MPNDYTKTVNHHILDAQACLNLQAKAATREDRALLIAEAQAIATIAQANATLALELTLSSIEREMPRIRGALR